MAVGFLLLVVKCACFRNPLPDEYSDDIDDFLSPHGEKKQNGSEVPNAVKEVNETHKDHNHHREEPTESEPMQPSVAAAAIAAAAAKESTNNKLSPS